MEDQISQLNNNFKQKEQKKNYLKKKKKLILTWIYDYVQLNTVVIYI